MVEGDDTMYTRGPPNKVVSLYKAVSRYNAVKIGWRYWGIALITRTAKGGFPDMAVKLLSIPHHTTPHRHTGGALLCRGSPGIRLDSY